MKQNFKYIIYIIIILIIIVPFYTKNKFITQNYIEKIAPLANAHDDENSGSTENSKNSLYSKIDFENGYWSTTFDYGPCTQRGGGGGVDCDKVKNDGVRWAWGARDIYGNYTQTNPEANNQIGGGGNGVRTWVASNPDESINQEASGQVGIDFLSLQKELRIRWYQRFQEGYNRNWIHYDKWLYIRTEEKSTDVIVGLYPGFTAVAQNTPNAYQVKSDWDWEKIMNGKYGDGKFHEYEVHIKMDTDSKNGIGQLWVDGVLVAENYNVDWSGGSESARAGWKYFDFENNQRYTDQMNGPIGDKLAYIDYDDMTIYNTVPPNKDSNGNPFIGPINNQKISDTAPVDSDPPKVQDTLPKQDTINIQEDKVITPPKTQTSANDNKAPIRSSGHSTSTLKNGGVSVSLSLKTDKVATCRYSIFPNIRYARMIKSFLTTEGISHSKTITVISKNKTYTYYVKCKDKNGKTNINDYVIKFNFSSTSNIPSNSSKTLFSEDFENTDFASRGWYDTTSGTLTSQEHISGSTNAIECKFLKGETKCIVPSRHLFTETDEVYVSYWVKYSKNREGSNLSYHPHEFMILTNEDDKYAGPAYNYLTAYIEQNEGVPAIALQDAKNIDSRITDLTETTESRAIAGCNGVLESEKTSIVSCYKTNGIYNNGKIWRAGEIYFSNSEGSYYKNDWHHVETYFKLNNIKDGIGQQDGVLKYWYDNNLIISQDNVLMRTGEHPNMKFNQLIFAPWIGDGSPVEQTFWIDNLTVATSRIEK